MIRRFSAALIVLALTMPFLAAAPVGAHGTGGLVIEVDTYFDDPNFHVTGWIESHFTDRRSNVTVTATFVDEQDAVVHEVSAPAFLPNLAPHATTPFHITVSLADIEGFHDTQVTVTSDGNGLKPVGALSIQGAILAPDGQTITGTVINDGGATATDVLVYALVDRTVIDSGASDPIATLTTGGSGSPFTINLIQTFDPNDDLLRLHVVARSTTGSDFTSWNNYFSDLGNSNFADEIGFIGNEGITTGCGAAIYCPKSNVTRAQMAVFLDRALGLPVETDPHPFTDIGTQSPAFQQAIQNLWGAGITGGCTATTFCPNQAVTRGQMSKFIVVGYGLTPIPGPGSFTDDDGHFSEQYNNRMAQDEITTGCGVGRFCPHAIVLREQMAKFLFEAEN